MSSSGRSLRVIIGFLLVVSVAVVLRVWGLDYGIPHPVARPDEEHAVGRAYHMLATGDLNPVTFDWPSFLAYIQTVALGMYFAVGKLLGHYERLWDFLFEIAVHRPGLHYLICRAVSVVCGVATVGVTYLLALRAHQSRTIALLAAAALATCHLHVRDSHFATPDVPMTLFVTLSLLFAIKAADKPTVINFVFAGVFAGFATSTKYNGGMVILGLAAAGWVSVRRSAGSITVPALAGRLLAAGLGMMLAFAATSPYAVIRYPAALEALRQVLNTHHQPQSGRAFWTHLGVTLPVGLGWPFFLAAAGGAVRAVWLRRNGDVVLLAFFLPFSVFISILSSVFPRYVIPVTPLLSLFAADIVNALVSQVKRKRSILYGVAVVGLCGPGLWSSIQFDRLAARKDTRILASEWVADNVVPQSQILLCRGYGAPHINEDRRRPPAFRTTSIGCTVGGLGDISVPYLITHDHPKLPLFSRVSDELEVWLAQRAELLAVFDPFRSTEVCPAYFYAADGFYLPFTGYDVMERGGPIIRIWRLPVDSGQ